MNALPSGVDVLVRGWLDGNCVALSGPEPALIDAGYHAGAEALIDWWRSVTGAPVEALTQIGLTHVHSDHAGGVAALRAHSAAPVLAHADAARLVAAWEPRSLWLVGTGQVMPRFAVDRALAHGEAVDLGGRRWRIVWTPGHAVGGVAWWCEHDGLLITGDALWEDGFGLLNTWIDGPEVFDLAAVALDNLAALDPRVVVPGHGAPFTDLRGALARARSRLDYLRRRPDRHRALAIRTLVGFRALSEGLRDPEALLTAALEAARAMPAAGPDAVGDEALCVGIVAALLQ